MILLTGGSGLLGQELQKQCCSKHKDQLLTPLHKEFDITDIKSVDKYLKKAESTIDLIVHSAAYTDVAMAGKEKDLCYMTNVVGTENLATFKIPMIYISTEYVFDGEKGDYKETDVVNPKNFYALTKLLGEFEAKRTDAVIIRTVFKPRPFEHIGACVDQFTSGDYVDIIAKEIMKVILNFKTFPRGIINIGTSKKSVYELAKQTREVKPIHRKDVSVSLPKDTSLDLTRWHNIKERLL